jgi:hypothetical protein
MIRLGIAPPYTLEDVKQAYLEKAKAVHPDHGGTAGEFAALQDAFERAQEFLAFRSDRRAWIAAQMDRYIALEKVIDRLRKLGAEVTTTSYEWMEQSYGDFAQLTETAVCVRAPGAANGDEIVAALVAERDPLRELREVELPGAKVSDDAVLSLSGFTMLRRLDLSGTPITERALDVVDDLPALETFEVDDTQLGWWKKHRLASRLRRRAD